MNRIRRIGGALIMAAMIAGWMAIGTAPVEAKGKKGDPQTAICAYLKSIIEYPYVSPYIKLWATSLYNAYGCPAL